MAKFTRTFVRSNEEMIVQTDSYAEMEMLIPALKDKGWSPEQNNWAGLVMATPSEQKPAPKPGECKHHPGRMKASPKDKGEHYCSAKLDDGGWCGYSTKPDGSVKKLSRLDRPVQPALTANNEIDF